MNALHTLMFGFVIWMMGWMKGPVSWLSTFPGPGPRRGCPCPTHAPPWGEMPRKKLDPGHLVLKSPSISLRSSEFV